MRKLSKKQILRIIIAALLGLLCIYILSRFSHIILGPRIVLDAKFTETLTSPVIDLSGHIAGGRLLWINGTQVPVEQNGHFETQLVVPTGYTMITLESRNELGSRRIKKIPVYYQPPEVSEETNTTSVEPPETESQIPITTSNQ